MTSADSATDGGATGSAGNRVVMILAWLWVAVPFLYGLISLLAKVPALFSV